MWWIAPPTAATVWVAARAPRDRWWLRWVVALQAVGIYGFLAGDPRAVGASHWAYLATVALAWTVVRHREVCALLCAVLLLQLALRAWLGRCPFDDHAPPLDVPFTFATGNAALLALLAVYRKKFSALQCQT